MKEGKNVNRTILTALIVIASVLILTCGTAAAAVTVTADTTGLIGKTSDTIRVPVIVTDVAEISTYQMIVSIRNDDNAKIEIDTNTLRGASSKDNGVVMYSEVANLDGTKPLFELLVTPKTSDSVAIELKEVRVYEVIDDGKGGKKTINAQATVIPSSLIIGGTGTGEIINDPNDGTTSVDGNTDEFGNFETGNEEGVTQIKTEGHTKEPVSVTKITDFSTEKIPDGVNCFFAYKVNTFTTGGEPYKITMEIAKDKLNAAGKTTDDLFITHQVDNKWYNVPIDLVSDAGDNVLIQFTAWSSGTYVLGYDNGGQILPTENAAISMEPTVAAEMTISQTNRLTSAATVSQTVAPTKQSTSQMADPTQSVNPVKTPTSSAASDTLDITKPPLLYALIGGGIAVLAIIIVIVVVISRRRRD